MDVFAYQLAKPDEYDGTTGQRIDPAYGENLPFTDIDGNPCHTGRAKRDEHGNREITLTLSTWVGTSAWNAVHWYAKLEDWGISGYSLDSDPDDMHHTAGRGDRAKPREMKRITVRIDRPATERDIKHWDLQHGDNPKQAILRPALGRTETGFWEKADAFIAGKAVFDRWFGDGWALKVNDPDCEDGVVPWSDDLLKQFGPAKAKERHDTDWKQKWKDPHAEDGIIRGPLTPPVIGLTDPTKALDHPVGDTGDGAGPDFAVSSPPDPKCRLCRKQRGNHKSGTLACPIGTKHRTFGYPGFHSRNVYTPC